ncbi:MULTISPECIES: LysE family translocator [unclassified Pseudomonas]|uniref:LysE family translocator n=1 Tax=unclassified Pseudomonas TaxID=196821 RepID=UPI000BC38A46|nr:MULTISPECIES: LysE family translocator [unclassified Pseudomonas]PVZ19531.1 threonine/homoserine/homoserine lactone efflux protein [Pseudomonas sp. URIL14HWK12:I12]PVZ22884.1 threonine/homoserine/homoserine lactone efflux protein [Pseudomonas sp. URIL14HWK12:I10]PVZ37486.1 threonine/homoserine/homoserine lactone efflux protein [Pseudomonas sp. URIL14HWK12:I11]SNZ14903.1 Threonine/homoserine/homoserine lactone efflux protein [Pseudomonas sp. URIL14HWK12:I9]
MSLATLLLFIPACFALNLAPGPNNLLALNNATQHGWRVACLAGLGRLAAFSVMIALAALGLATILVASQWAFAVIKTVGAFYLLWLAVQLWRAPVPEQARFGAPIAANVPGLMRTELLVAAGNPKAILIFTAFLPQFLELNQPPLPQFAVLGMLFLVLEWVAIGIYAWLGLHARRWLATRSARRLFNRASGTLLGAAGTGLLLSRH